MTGCEHLTNLNRVAYVLWIIVLYAVTVSWEKLVIGMIGLCFGNNWLIISKWF